MKCSVSTTWVAYTETNGFSSRWLVGGLPSPVQNLVQSYIVRDLTRTYKICKFAIVFLIKKSKWNIILSTLFSCYGFFRKVLYKLPQTFCGNWQILNAYGCTSTWGMAVSNYADKILMLILCTLRGNSFQKALYEQMFLTLGCTIRHLYKDGWASFLRIWTTFIHFGCVWAFWGTCAPTLVLRLLQCWVTSCLA